MRSPELPRTADRLRRKLREAGPSDRLQAALTAGLHPHPEYLDLLIERCAVEPDFFVRDMLTWSLTRHPAALTVPRLLLELANDAPQARSQALHTLSKIADPVAWPAVTNELLRDPDDEVARSAWRAAVVLVPKGGESELAQQLCSQLGRGGRDLQLSLSRALAAMGDVARPVLAGAASRGDEKIRAHALATQRLLDHPDEGFDAALFEAQRIIALTGVPGGVDVDR